MAAEARRNAHDDLGTALVEVAGGSPNPVRRRDRLDDRQAQPGSLAAARLVRTAEALEGAGQEVVAEAGSAIADGEAAGVAVASRGDLNRSAPVAERVV